MPDCTNKVCRDDGCGGMCGECVGLLEWARRAGGSHSEVGDAIHVTEEGTSFVVGLFGFEATFGPGEPNETMLTSDGNKDYFVARYDSDGMLAWARRGGGTEFDRANGVCGLTDGRSFVAGPFQGTATFGQGDPNETTLVSAGDVDIYIARYNSQGELDWVGQAGGTGQDVGGGVAGMSDGSVLVSGYISGTATFGRGEPNETTLTAFDRYFGMFFARYNQDGSLAWARGATGTYGAMGGSITVLPDESALVTGTFGRTAVFGQGEPNETIIESPEYENQFIARYNPDGSLAWVRHVLAQAVGSSSAISDGSVLLAGCFGNTAVFAPGEENETTLTPVGRIDVFVARYNPDGSLVWVRQDGGVSLDWGYGVSALPDGSSVVAGSFDGSATFGLGEPNETTLESVGDYDIFVAKYNSNGTLAWVRRHGGPGSDTAYGISVMPDGSSLVSGEFHETATFGPGEPNETNLTSAGFSDVFVIKIGP